jgi:hypothetical protein
MERRGGRGDKVILLGGGGGGGTFFLLCYFFVLTKRGVWGEYECPLFLLPALLVVNTMLGLHLREGK